jgi:hypothetical protein
MMVGSKSSNQRPDTLMQDRIRQIDGNPLAPHGRTIHMGHRRTSTSATGKACFAPMSGHRQTSRSGPKRADTRSPDPPCTISAPSPRADVDGPSCNIGFGPFWDSCAAARRSPGSFGRMRPCFPPIFVFHHPPRQFPHHFSRFSPTCRNQ